MSTLRFAMACVLACLVLTDYPVIAKSRIEAIRGKRYSLRTAHGPWLIMVASLRDVEEDLRSKVGLSAWQAADELVFALRSRGIPSYAFLQKSEFGQILSEARKGGTDGRYIARHESIAVLAGNFQSPEERKAKIVLKYIQNKFDPKFLKDKGSGAIVTKTPGRPRPFSRAFIVPNPLRDQEDLNRSILDPLIRKLNAGIDESLLKNKGKYSLLVATLAGNSVMQVGYKEDKRHTKLFDEQLGSNLDATAQKAWELTAALRQAKRLSYDRNYDAWVYHDKYKSYVTIGSFESKTDPRIAQLKNQFQAKMKPNPKTGEIQLTPEMFSIPKNPQGTTLPDKLWFFDMKPRVIRIPGK